MQSEIAGTSEAHSAGQGKQKGPSNSDAEVNLASNMPIGRTGPIDLERNRDIDMSLASALTPSSSSNPTPLPAHVVSEALTLASGAAKPRSRPASRDTSPYPRSRPSTPGNRPSPTTSAAPRRSQRASAKGPERPRGPPELEAALAIAIRNLESDIYAWWCANQKPGSPLPTTAYLKARSPRIRRAAEAVDEADRLVNEAVYGKPRKKRGPAKKNKEPDASVTPDRTTGDGDVPDTAFEQLELNSQPEQSSPPRPTETKAGDSDGRQSGRSSRNKDGPGD